MTTETPSELESALADRYAVRQVLGKGGMATVYLAHDRKHQREVAVKVLRPDLAATLGTDRFLKEIQIVARLTHPHILALHDSGEAGGFLYYVMPYITGGSLRNRLEAMRRLDREEAMAIALPVADALAYAHRMGIFHRDIKPENILFSEGHPVVADFGIAKAVSTAGVGNLTRTGFPLGTPGYMSPEQAAGMTDLDERTDVYSLAVVIYEMLVGETPGRWPTEDAYRAGRFLEAPPAHRSRLTGAGAATEAALVRALAIRHDQRTPTPSQLMDELTGTVSGPRRRYGEDEVRQIVQRATELEATNPTSGSMTIGGVEALAAEVGVAPELVRQAAKSLSTPSDLPSTHVASGWTPVIGGPTTLVFERVVTGEVPDFEFPVLVDEIRRNLQHVGQVSQLGRSFSWTMSHRAGMKRDVEVGVSVRAGQTRIVVRENLGPTIGAIFGGICGGVGGGGMGPILGITVGAFGLPAVAIAGIIPLWLATVFTIARTTYRRAIGRREKEFQALADRLASLAEELVSLPPAIASPQQPRLKS
ncbi:MAG TPA: serine/threonine-protein kinase [Gemmatimonadales bacterium]|nr:serine/threonine-protein kinase [Gemmatimonadales bacterium]